MLCVPQPEKIRVPVQCHVGTEDKFVLADVSDPGSSWESISEHAARKAVDCAARLQAAC